MHRNNTFDEAMDVYSERKDEQSIRRNNPRPGTFANANARPDYLRPESGTCFYCECKPCQCERLQEDYMRTELANMEWE